MALVINPYPRQICQVYRVININILNLGLCSSRICGTSASSLLLTLQNKVSALEGQVWSWKMRPKSRWRTTNEAQHPRQATTVTTACQRPKILYAGSLIALGHFSCTMQANWTTEMLPLETYNYILKSENKYLTLILLTWRRGWAHNNARK